MIITIGGSIGSGKTTLAQDISKKFKFRHISAGEIMRDMANEKGMSLLEFSKYAESNLEIDREIDNRQKKLVRGNCIIDGRLSAYFLKPDIAIWLNAPPGIRAKRIMQRDGIKKFSEAKKHISKREKSEKIRYRKIYGIDLEDMGIYELIINTGKFDIKTIGDIISAAIRPFSLYKREKVQVAQKEKQILLPENSKFNK